MKNLILLVMLISFGVSAQWVPAKGKGYYKFATQTQVSSKHFNAFGDKEDNATRSINNYSFYFEHGIGKGWGIQAYIPYLSLNQSAQVDGNTGIEFIPFTSASAIGNPIITFEKQLSGYQEALPNFPWISGGVNIELPLGKEIFDQRIVFQTGNESYSIEPVLKVGNGFGKGYYYKASVAYGFRNGDFSDEWSFKGAIGGSKGKWFGQLLYNIKESTYNGSGADDSVGLFANNVEFFMLGPEIAYNITDKIGISLNYQHAISGRVLFSGPSISGGIYLNLK